MKKLIIALLLLGLAVNADAGYTKRGFIEPETVAYNTTVAGVNTVWWTTNEAIKTIKYGSGITLASVVANFNVTASPFVTRATYTSTTVPSNDLRWLVISGVQLTVNDGTNSMTLTPVAPGTGETLGSELATTWTVTSGYGTMSAPSPPNIAEAIGNVALDNVVRFGPTTGLLKYAYTLSLASGTAPVFTTGLTAGITSAPLQAGAGAKSGYWTVPAAARYFGFRNALEASNFSTSSSSFKLVLTPDATGFTASNLTLGSFNPNAASVTITARRP